MTKTGKPDTYWHDICTKYAQGQFHFSTGKRPGAKKRKKALEEIDACPLQTNTKDLFGRSLRCSCGFHKPADHLSGACSSKAGEVETEAGAVRGDAETRRRSGSMVVLWFQSSPHLGNLLTPPYSEDMHFLGERIAVEYLLAQTNRGDLLAPKQMPEIPTQVLEEDEDEPDATVCMPGDLGAVEPDAALCQSAELGAGGSAVEDQVSLEGDTEPGPLVAETSQSDSRGVVGWEAVDALAAYLVDLNRTITALSVKEEADIVRLYTALHAMDKAPSRYSPKSQEERTCVRRTVACTQEANKRQQSSL
ncbi:hypothetical protein D5F01_LYC09992 [Larimichthys crocea]|uniref:Uncharacterized protein n=1 Tax=Larimichthys crocea TaxID=215358 RepID=A0A6G0IMG7_LARCR|nr:hypothetical protein D5F01_LYC09992 [Larimichthys crocea]